MASAESVIIDRQQPGTPGIYQQTGTQPHRQHAAEAVPQGLAHTGILTGTHILTDKIDGSLLEGIHGDIDEAFQILGCGVAGHEDLAKGIDRGLNDHVGDGKQGALNTGRKPDADHFQTLGAVKPHFGQAEFACVGPAHQHQYHQYRGNALGNGGGKGNACHVHMQPCDKDHIQHHIDDTGKEQEDQRALGIPCRPEDRCTEIVDHSEDDPA